MKLIYFQELELYKESLLDKPAMLLFNKCDLPEAKLHLNETLKHVENLKGRVYTFSKINR